MVLQKFRKKFCQALKISVKSRFPILKLLFSLVLCSVCYSKIGILALTTILRVLQDIFLNFYGRISNVHTYLVLLEIGYN